MDLLCHNNQPLNRHFVKTFIFIVFRVIANVCLSLSLIFRLRLVQMEVGGWPSPSELTVSTFAVL